MTCCSFGETVEKQFSAERVAEELRRYRTKGAGPTARLLADGIAAAQLTNGRLMDVGGGFGALTHDLLDKGISSAVIIEASPAYLRAASEEAARRGRASAIECIPGDFVAIADQLPSTPLLTLDRVVCCYPSYVSLLERVVQKAESGIAFSYPRNRWYVRLGIWVENTVRRWRGNPFRAYVDSPFRMSQILETAGFVLVWRRRTLMWSADVFVRRR